MEEGFYLTKFPYLCYYRYVLKNTTNFGGICSMMKKASALLAVCVLLAGLWGCSPSQSSSSQSTSSSQSESSSQTESSSASQSQSSSEATFPVTITDAAGREVTIEKEPKTLVSGYYITSSMVMALGQTEKLVGIEAKADTRPIYSLAAPTLLELPSVGTAKEFDLEGCAALKPDLAILPVKLKDSAEDLEELGIPSIVVSPENLEQLADTLTILGQATGSSEQAEKILNFTKEKQEFLQTSFQDVEKPSVYLAGNSSFLNTAGAKMYQNTLIELGGGVNVAAELEDTYWSEISYEQLLAWNPSVIVIAPEASYTKEELMQDAQLSQLDAVKNGKVYQMPSSIEAWDSPVPSAILGSLWMASVLHEDVYTSEQFQQDATSFYSEFYGFTPTSAMLSGE